MSVTGTVKRQVARVIGSIARALTSGQLRILMYHRFGPDGTHRRLGITDFEEQVRYLKAYFRPARLDEVVARLRAGRPIDPRTVVITVDDGYADFASYAYPVLKRHGVPATVYVVSRFINGKCWLWFDALQWVADAAPNGRHELTLGGTRMDVVLDTTDDHRRLWSSVADLCVIRAPLEQWAIVNEFAAQLGVTLPALPTPEFSAMGWPELKHLDPDIVEVGAHTLSHPILSRCSKEVQEQEVRGCKEEIEQALGREVRAFCYPNGLPADFTAETQSIVAACGYSNAVMACGGMGSPASHLYRLERLGAPEDMSLFRNAINGIWHLRGSA